MYRAPIIVATLGVVILVIAIALPLVFPSLLETKLREKLVIRPDSDMLKSFQETPIPIYFKVHFFNLTNSDQVLEGAKPKLDEVGPYTYRMQKHKVDIEFNHSAGTVVSKGKKFFYFERDMSVGPDSDVITTLNLVYMTLAKKFSSDSVPYFMQSIAQFWFFRFDASPFMTHPVKEILFQGFDEEVLKELYPLTNKQSHKDGKSGFFYNKNGTAGNEIEIITGELGMDDYQELVKYKGKEKLDYWNEDRCNVLKGTLGSQFARPIDTNEPLYLFSPSLCRTVYLIYEKDTTLGPITLHRFKLPLEVLAKKEENDCYCSSNFTCRASMIDCSPCKGGAPIIVSTAHFLGGDKADIEGVEGLNPIQEKHETFLDIEPNTGVTMRAHKRSQVNMPLRKYSIFPPLDNVTDAIVPIFWMDEEVEAPLERAEKLYMAIIVPTKVVSCGAYILLGIGVLLLCISFGLTCKIYKNNQRQIILKRQQQIDKIYYAQNSKLLNEKSAF